MTTIRYFIPEDGDTEEHPNIYLMPKPTQSGFSPRLGDIKDSFPVPGNYHFRFKSPLIPGTDREKGAISVWMDCVDDDQHVGVWRNTIFAKVTRINMNDDYDDYDDDDFVRPRPVSASVPTRSSSHHSNGHGNGNGIHHGVPASTRAAPAPTPVRQQSNQHQHQQPQPTPTRVQVPARAASRAPAPAPAPAAAPAAEANLLGGFDAVGVAPSASGEGDLLGTSLPPAPPPGGGLLDMNMMDSGVASGNSSSLHDDFLGMNMDSTPVTSPPVSGGGPVSGGSNMSGTGMQQQQQAQAMPRPSTQPNAFSANAGPFGGLNW